jgi:hypothetical protein
MGVLSSFVTAWRLALTSQALILPALVYSLLSLPQMLLQLFYSGESAGVLAGGAAYSLLLWLVTPFFAGGLLATAAKALREGVSLDSFVSSGRRSYLYLLLAGVIYMLVLVAGMFVIAILAIALGVGVKAVLSSDVAFAFAVIFTIFSALILIVVMIMLNFYDVGVAIDGLDPVKTFKNSFRFVKSRPLAVLGFLLLSSFTLMLLYTPIALVFFYHIVSSLPELGLEELEAGALPKPGFGLGVILIFLLIVTNTIATCFTYTYRAVFYVDARR